MSLHIQARFYEKSGQYVATWLTFKTDDLLEAANQFACLRAGWIASGRGTMVWDSVISCGANPQTFKIPEDCEKLRDYLERYKDVTSNSTQDQGQVGSS